MNRTFQKLLNKVNKVLDELVDAQLECEKSIERSTQIKEKAKQGYK